MNVQAIEMVVAPPTEVSSVTR